MSEFDVEEDMTRAARLDQKIDSLLRGIGPDAGDPLGAELALMRQNLSEAFPLPVVPEDIKDAHVARMMAAVTAPATFAAPSVTAGRTALDSLKASFSRRVAALTLALGTAFGGAAYAGVLPGPVQRAAARAASVVGLDLPGGEDETLVENEPDGSFDGRPGEDGRGIDPAPEGSGSEQRDRSGATDDGDAERRRDDDRDAREDAGDDARDGAEDRRGDAAEQRKGNAGEARDADEDAEDAAEDRRDDLKDRREDEADRREDDADDERDASKEAEDDAEDEADEARDARDDGREAADLDEDDPDDPDSDPGSENESDD